MPRQHSCHAMCKIYSNHLTIVWMTEQWNLHKFQLRLKNRSWNGPTNSDHSFISHHCSTHKLPKLMKFPLEGGKKKHIAQCLLTVNWTHMNKLQWNFNQNILNFCCKMHLKMSAKCRLLSLGFNVLRKCYWSYQQLVWQDIPTTKGVTSHRNTDSYGGGHCSRNADYFYDTITPMDDFMIMSCGCVTCHLTTSGTTGKSSLEDLHILHSNWN